MASLSASSPMVGRADECRLLREALGRAVIGEPRTVVVCGEAGVGKTRLVDRFRSEAEASGVQVLAGACTELESEVLPFAPVIFALRGLIRRIGLDALASLLPDQTALGLLLPELALRHQQALSRPRLFQDLCILIDRLSNQGPVLFVIEDLHWADQSTLDLLRVLTRCLRGSRLLIVISYRTDDVLRGGPLRKTLAELERLPGVQRVQLRRFSRAETAELIRAGSASHPSADLIDRIFDRSGGNAFFVGELLRAERAGITDAVGGSLRELLLDRIESLPKPAQRIVAIASVGGRWLPHWLLAAVAGLPDDDLFDALRCAVDGHLLVIDAEGYSFRHALVQEVALENLLPGMRKSLHRSYAEAMEESHYSDLPERSEIKIAHHWLGAREFTKAFPALLRAAAFAKSVYAHAERYEMLSRALEIWPTLTDSTIDRLDVLEDAAITANFAGEQEAALDLIDQALTELRDREHVDSRRSAVLLARRADLLLDLGREGALATVAEAERLMPAESSTARATVMAVLGDVLERAGQLVRAREVCEEAVQVAAESAADELAVSGRTTLGLTLTDLGDHQRALSELAKAQAQAEHSHDLHALTRIHLFTAAALIRIGRHEEAVAVAGTGIALASQTGLVSTYGCCLMAAAAVSLLALGRWDEANEEAARALDTNAPELYAFWAFIAGCEIAVARGDKAAAESQLTAAQTALNCQYIAIVGRLALARLTAEVALWNGRVQDARQAVAAVLDLARQPGAGIFAWTLLTTAARVEVHAYARLHRLEEGSASDSLIKTLQEVAAGHPVDLPPSRAHAAQFAAELDSLETPSTNWSKVVADWDRAGEPYPASYARLRAAEAAIAARDQSAAKSWLVTAAEETQRLGAVRLHADIEMLARRADISLKSGGSFEEDSAAPVQTNPAQRLGLTPREAQVLRLITDGRSNRDIAKALQISVNTAAVHVSRILAKLSVTSRGEAAAVAHRLRLFVDATAGQPSDAD